jgi:predicted dehydrogenase
MSTYRMAVLGCGPRGRSQARAIQQHPRAELVALCDLDAQRLDILADELGVAARFGDFEQMIREQRPDVMHIPTASRFHAELAIAALQLGCHVDVEKPLTLTLDELDRLMAAQRASGKLLAPHHQAAVSPPATKLRELVQQGYIGVPQALRIRDKGYYGGYGIIHQGCHALALAITLLGPARSVSAHMVTAGHPTTVDEVYQGPYGYGLVAGQHLTCLFELANGVYLLDEEHERLPVDSRTARFEVVGTEGALALDQPRSYVLHHSPNPHWKPGDGAWSVVPLSPAERTLAGYDYTDEAQRSGDLWMVDEWVHALDGGRDVVVNAAVGANTMEMIHGAYASHAERRRIDLPQQSRTHPLQRWLEREHRPLPPPAPAGYAEWLPWAQEAARA